MVTTTAPAAHTTRIPWDTITPRAQAQVTNVLTLLGQNRGVVEDMPPVVDAATRTTLADMAADLIGLDLTPGHEIAQCFECQAITDGAHTHGDTIHRCTDCYLPFLASIDRDHIPADTTREHWN